MSLIEHDHEFISLRAGDYYASISAFGGGPRACEYQGRPLLVDYPLGVNPPLSAGVVLAPWPNRVADGVFSHRGNIHRLTITEPARANAIHGFAANVQWSVQARDDASVTLSTILGPEPGWPWRLSCTMEWTLDAREGLHGQVSVRNESAESAPLGVGLHPYLSAAGAPLDDSTLILPARENLPIEPVRNLPAGPLIPAALVLDGLNSGVRMNGVWLDSCFSRVSDEDNRVRLIGPDGAGVEMQADQEFGWFQLYTADPGRGEGFPGHGRALAVEPMTCPPDALRSGIDLIELDPGAVFTAGFNFAFVTP